MVSLEVVQAQRAAEARELGGECARERAAVEIVEASPREPLEGRRERRKALPRHRSRRLRVVQERTGESGLRRELVQKSVSVVHLALRDGRPFARVPDGILEQARERQPAADDAERGLPAGHRAGNGVGRQRSARRNGRVALRFVYQSGVARPAARPQASMPIGGLPGRLISQNPSPPMLFMCG